MSTAETEQDEARFEEWNERTAGGTYLPDIRQLQVEAAIEGYDLALMFRNKEQRMKAFDRLVDGLSGDKPFKSANDIYVEFYPIKRGK